MKNRTFTPPQHPSFSRRSFLSASAAATASFFIVPRHVLGGAGQIPPSEKVNVASIGAGGMAKHNITSSFKSGLANIVALCDVDEEKAAEMYNQFPEARKYRDFRVMLENQKDIDAVIIATPDHTHAVATMMAMKMGKHVYTQKPLTHDIYEARMLTEAAKQYKVATQMGNQGRSGEGTQLMKEWVMDGAIGEVREVHCWTNRPIWPQGMTRPTEIHAIPSTLDWDLWLGTAPMRPYNKAYAPFRWRGYWDFGTGALGDMACHIMDQPYDCLELGYPISVEASYTVNASGEKRAEIDAETAPMASIIKYEFPARGSMPPVDFYWYDGSLLPFRPQDLDEGRQLGDGDNGMLLIGSKASLVAGCYGNSPRIIPETKMKEYKRPPKTLPRVEGGTGGHEDNWLQACKGQAKATSPFEYAGPLTEAVLLGNLAIRAGGGKKLLWDGPNMKVTNYPEVNQYVRREYRAGWSL